MACKRQQEHVNTKLEAMFSRLLGYFSISNIVYTVLWMLTTIISTKVCWKIDIHVHVKWAKLPQMHIKPVGQSLSVVHVQKEVHKISGF